MFATGQKTTHHQGARGKLLIRFPRFCWVTQDITVLQNTQGSTKGRNPKIAVFFQHLLNSWLFFVFPCQTDWTSTSLGGEHTGSFNHSYPGSNALFTSISISPNSPITSGFSFTSFCGTWRSEKNTWERTTNKSRWWFQAICKIWVKLDHLPR